MDQFTDGGQLANPILASILSSAQQPLQRARRAAEEQAADTPVEVNPKGAAAINLEEKFHAPAAPPAAEAVQSWRSRENEAGPLTAQVQTALAANSMLQARVSQGIGGPQILPNNADFLSSLLNRMWVPNGSLAPATEAQYASSQIMSAEVAALRKAEAQMIRNVQMARLRQVEAMRNTEMAKAQQKQTLLSILGMSALGPLVERQQQQQGSLTGMHGVLQRTVSLQGNQPEVHSTPTAAAAGLNPVMEQQPRAGVLPMALDLTSKPTGIDLNIDAEEWECHKT
eukprot:gene5928-7132_t